MYNIEIYNKLEAFIKKYYINQIIKGFIISLVLILLLYFALSTLEYFNRFQSIIRFILFVSFLSFTSLTFIRFIFIPFLSLIKLKKRINYEDSSKIIGSYFPEIRDKLLNIIQLDNMKDNNSLILASIEQKSLELTPFNFKNAIDYKENRKYLRFLIPIFFFLVGILIFFPSLLLDGTKRIVNYNKDFKKIFPYEITFNKPLYAIKGETYIIDFSLVGKELPTNVDLVIDDKIYKTTKIDKNRFNFTVNNIQKDINFEIKCDNEKFNTYKINTLLKPTLNSLVVNIDYPNYLGLNDEKIINPSEIVVPAGSKLSWSIRSENANELFFIKNDTINKLKSNSNSFNFSFLARETFQFYLLPNNSENKIKSDSILNIINVLPDLYPSIEVSQKPDSTKFDLIYFDGIIKDDHGFTNLSFYYSIQNTEKNISNKFTLPISKNLTSQEFNLPFDVNLLNLDLGDKLTYYFQVFDNDGFLGPKSVKSSQFTYNMPTKDELVKNISDKNEEIESSLDKSKEFSEELNDHIDKLKKQLLQKKEITFDEKKKLQDLLKKEQELNDKIEQLNSDKEENNKKEDLLNKDEERLLDKNQKINELFKELKDEKLEKLLEDLNKMMDKMDKNQMLDILDKMKMNNEDLEKELDRTLELFKQMQFEEQLQNTVDKLKELEENQNKQTENISYNKENKDDEKKGNDLLDQLKDDINKLNEMNNDLENKNNLDSLNQKLDDIKNDMNNSSQQNSNKQNGKSQKSMKNAQKKTNDLKNELEQMQEQNSEEANEENLEDLKQLLDNVLKLSFDQENLISKTNQIQITNPKFKDILVEQKKLIDDSKIVEDSLLALSKRVSQISSMVNKEITQVKTSMNSSLDQLEMRNKSQSSNKQQYALTSLNNLALLLSEAINQMQDQMKNGESSGSKSCKKPKNKPGGNMQSLLEKQMGLQKKMQELMGKKQGSKEGNKGDNGEKMGEGEFNKNLVQLANEQEEIRKELEKLSEGMNGDQKKQINDIMKKMEENENDLLNKRISSTTINRNEEIKIKMLESEKAERKQDEDEKRKSNEGKDLDKSNNSLIENYMKKYLKSNEILLTNPPILKPYFKNKVSNYINN